MRVWDGSSKASGFGMGPPSIGYINRCPTYKPYLYLPTILQVLCPDFGAFFFLGGGGGGFGSLAPFRGSFKAKTLNRKP